MPVVYDINTHVASNASVRTAAGGPFEVTALIGYEDSEAPFVVYKYRESNYSTERYFILQDYISYTIYDTDLVRGWLMSEAMIKLLNQGDSIAIPASQYVIKWMKLMGSSTKGFTERDGFFAITLEFQVGYTKK